MAITDAQLLAANKIPHWEDAPSEWDRLVIGNFVMPGVWDIEFSCRRAIDVKKSKGTDGSRLKDEGYETPLIELTGRLASPEQWLELQSILPKLHPKKKGEKRETYGIQHPKATLLGIASIYIVLVKSPRLDRGIMNIELNAYEWVPAPKPVKANSKPPIKRTINDGFDNNAPFGPKSP